MPPRSRALLDALAELTEYPGAPLGPAVQRCRALLDPPDASVASALARFGGWVERASDSEHQEAYTDVFDLRASCALDVGWHLFGDMPDRPAFMVAMREALQRVAVPEGREMPDHLARVLQLLGRDAPDRAGALARLVLPAVAAVRRALSERGSPYADLLTAIEAVVESVTHQHSPEIVTP